MRPPLQNIKMNLRRLAKASIAYTAYGSGLIDRLAARRTGINGQHRIIIIGYHRVVEDFKASSKLAIPSLLISAQTFRRHLELALKKFDCISLDDAVEAISGNRELRRDAVVITFDDGYRDFYEVAYPILRSFGLPATIFVPTSLIDEREPLVHDQLYYLTVEMKRRNRSIIPLLKKLNLTYPIPQLKHALSSKQPDYFEAMRALFEIPHNEVKVLINEMKNDLGFSISDFPTEYQLLTWQMLREVASGGITIGAHTRNHLLLTRESIEQAEREIQDSKKDLEDRLGIRADHFAYPDGRYNNQISDIVWRAGFKSACTIEDRPNTLMENVYQLKRKLLWEQACLGIFSDYSEIVAECQLRGLFANSAYRLQPKQVISYE